MNKFGQEQRLEQTSTLTASQIQAIKILELTNLELESRIEKELEENPALEETYDEDLPSEKGEDADDWELGEYASEDDIPAYKLQELQERQSFREEIPFASATPGLDEMLLDQLSMTELDERQLELARYIVGNISSDGYLLRSVEDLRDDLLFRAGIDASAEELERLIERIQELDPAGIAARDLRECLLLQLRRREPIPIVEQSIRILSDCYSDFVSKQFDAIYSSTGISPSMLSKVYEYISHLNPKPGGSYSDDASDKLAHYTPDFLVYEQDGVLQLAISGEREIAPLRLSADYVAMVEDARKKSNTRQGKEAFTFLKSKVEQARWFIDALTQRQQTLRRTMLAIMTHQQAFFLSGDARDLRPMVLRDIAQATDLDISTISRVSNSKSVQTDFGIFPLKYFFGEGISSDSGQEVSTREVKQALVQLIEEEDKQAPLSDAQLTDQLATMGYPLARRTVAKYREQLRLPIARLRRKV